MENNFLRRPKKKTANTRYNESSRRCLPRIAGKERENAMLETPVQHKNDTYPMPKLWTKEECHRLVERGELDERYELIEGVIFYPMPKYPPHVFTVRLLIEWLVGLFGYDFVQKEDPIAIPGKAGKINEPEPDAAVLRRRALAINDGPPGPEDILLVVEVSDSSLQFDLNTKAKVYARAGIAEYWVMDVKGRQIWRRRKPGRNRYGEIVTFREDQMIAAPGREDSARVSDLFAPVPEN